jgi:hypothetical protein
MELIFEKVSMVRAVQSPMVSGYMRAIDLGTSSPKMTVKKAGITYLQYSCPIYYGKERQRHLLCPGDQQQGEEEALPGLGKEEEALVQILARANSRKWDLLEEAALLRELHDQYHLSQSRIASMVGRKQSWVSGRLALYSALSEDLLESIRRGPSRPGQPPE